MGEAMTLHTQGVRCWVRSGIALVGLGLLLAGCHGKGSTPNDGNPSQDPAPVLQVTMQPQPTIEPPFKGTGIVFTPPAEMNSTGAGGGATVNGDALDRPAVEYNPDWMNNRVAVSDGFAVFMPDWVSWAIMRSRAGGRP
jgi:hypothetical protein